MSPGRAPAREPGDLRAPGAAEVLGDDDRAVVVDVGAGRPGDQQVAERCRHALKQIARAIIRKRPKRTLRKYDVEVPGAARFWRAAYVPAERVSISPTAYMRGSRALDRESLDFATGGSTRGARGALSSNRSMP